MNKFFIITSVCSLMAIYQVKAQKVAVKTNLLYDVTSTINLGVEIGLAPKLTLDLSGNLNPWIFNKNTNSKIQHTMVQPELRYWLCERFKGHFFGAHMHWAKYNVGGVDLPFGLTEDTWAKYRYRGDLYGAGVGYGYQWVFKKRWAVEAELGIGYAYLKYDKYACKNCGEYMGNKKMHYFGPTKAAISFIYIIK